jgi:hypothetical protein
VQGRWARQHACTPPCAETPCAAPFTPPPPLRPPASRAPSAAQATTPPTWPVPLTPPSPLAPARLPCTLCCTGHYVPNLAWAIVQGNARAAAGQPQPQVRTPLPSTLPPPQPGRPQHSLPAFPLSLLGSHHPSHPLCRHCSLQEEEAGGAGAYVEGHVNLKGVFVGNAWTDPAIDNKGASCPRVFRLTPPGDWPRVFRLTPPPPPLPVTAPGHSASPPG